MKENKTFAQINSSIKILKLPMTNKKECSDGRNNFYLCIIVIVVIVIIIIIIPVRKLQGNVSSI